MDIKIKAKLQAYTKGILPTKLSQLENDVDFIEDAQGSIDKDGKYYVRHDGQWVDITPPEPSTSDIILADNSGLNLEKDGEYRKLSIRQVTSDEYPSTIEEDTTYYIVENTPDVYINGGTAFSDGNNDYVDSSEYQFNINGGNANAQFDLDLLPINAKGVYNGN